MPLVRISLLQGRSDLERRRIGDALHRAMVETIDVEEHDRFQVIEQYPPTGIVYLSESPTATRTDNLVLIQITLNRGRSSDKKQRFFNRAVALLQSEAGVRREDVFIGLIEVDPDDWFVP